MGINLPTSEQPFLPKVPVSVRDVSTELYDYLEKLDRFLSSANDGFFENDRLITTVINSGVSGTFTLSSGGSIVVTSGIVISVTS